ncbi:MAG TPA: hypothetical protein VF230_03300 [Acidimicrobiales bacterium]
MMWLVPAAIAVLAALPIVLVARRLVGEAVQLRRDVQRFSDLRPALLELRSEAETFRRGVAVRLPRR